MNKNAIFLLGNGFNYCLKKYIDDKNLKKEIEGIINLWKEISEFFGEIRKIPEYKNLTDENIIEIIHNSINLLELLPLVGDKSLGICLEKFREEFLNEVNERLLNIVERFIEVEKDGIYVELANFYHKSLEKNFFDLISENNISIYTTNYDGIAEIILAYDKNEYDYRKIKLRDMFRASGNDKYNIFDIDNYFEDIDEPKLIHLHGSYKFFLYSNHSIKIKKFGWDFYNENKDKLLPILIFDSPKLKEEQINKFDVLKFYFQSFKTELKNVNNLIIWGQSLKNDPHIKKIIIDSFIKNSNTENKLIVIDIKSEHKIQKYCDSINVIFINPENFKTFEELMDEIFSKLS